MSTPAPAAEVVAYLISDLSEFRQMVVDYLAPPHLHGFPDYVDETLMDAAYAALVNGDPLDPEGGPGRMLMRAMFEVAERWAAAVDAAPALPPASGLADDPTTLLGSSHAVVVTRDEYEPSAESAEEWRKYLDLFDSAAPGVFRPAVLLLAAG